MEEEAAKLEITELETTLEGARTEHERERRELDELLRERDILNKKLVLASGANQKQLDQVKVHENTRRSEAARQPSASSTPRSDRGSQGSRQRWRFPHR